MAESWSGWPLKRLDRRQADKGRLRSEYNQLEPPNEASKVSSGKDL
jgi:hypothetical protein